MKIPCLDLGFVEYIDHLGNDLRIVNAARVSMGKHKEVLDESDESLIQYLIKNFHTSPFRHCAITFRMKMPIFVARQYVKHRIGVEINEISGRYVEFKPEFHTPYVFREGSKNIKQGSKDTTIRENEYIHIHYAKQLDNCYRLYKKMLRHNVCKEQARMVLPVSLYTEFYATMSLQAIQHFYFLRADSHAQKEIQEYAFAISIIAGLLFPTSWPELTK